MMRGYYTYNMHPGGFWGGGLIDMAFTILFWIAIAFIVISLVKGIKHHGIYSDFENKKDSALDILKQRYAKGEITRKEFTEMKKDIE